MFKPTRLWKSLVMLALCSLSFATPALAGGKGKNLEGVINLNTASSDELQLLSGVGPAKAEKIIEYRRKHPFRTVEELGRVKGLGTKTVHKLRTHLTVQGPTTAHQAGQSQGPSHGKDKDAEGEASQPEAHRKGDVSDDADSLGPAASR